MGGVQSFLLVLLLLVATYIDIKKREIPDAICICIGILSLFGVHPLGVLAALPFFICAMINPSQIGGGDIKLTAAVGLVLGFWPTLYGLVIALSITTMLYIAIIIRGKAQEAKRMSVPLAPFLTIGFSATLLIF